MTWTDDAKRVAAAALHWVFGLLITAVGVAMIFKTDLPRWGVGVGLFGLYFMVPTEVKSFVAWAVGALGDFLKRPGSSA